LVPRRLPPRRCAPYFQRMLFSARSSGQSFTLTVSLFVFWASHPPPRTWLPQVYPFPYSFFSETGGTSVGLSLELFDEARPARRQQEPLNFCPELNLSDAFGRCVPPPSLPPSSYSLAGLVLDVFRDSLLAPKVLSLLGNIRPEHSPFSFCLICRFSPMFGFSLLLAAGDARKKRSSNSHLSKEAVLRQLEWRFSVCMSPWVMSFFSLSSPALRTFLSSSREQVCFLVRVGSQTRSRF